MDIDTSSAGSASSPASPSSTPAIAQSRHAASTPSNATHAAIDSLGGSVSRSARLRATTSNDEQEDSDAEESDAGACVDHRSKAFPANTSHMRGPASLLPRPSAFVTASRGERYLLQSGKPAKTSAAKLSDTFRKPCSQQSLVKLLVRQSASPKGKATERQLRLIEDGYIQLFSQWRAELGQHFRLLFYGLGSKIRLLHIFAQRCLRSAIADGRIAVVDGFKSNVSVLDMVAALESILLPAQERADDPLYTMTSAARIDERVNALLGKLDKSGGRISTVRPIYMLVHSIDGPALRAPRFQATLWTLCSHPHVRLIASFDHAKSPLLLPVTGSNLNTNDMAGARSIYSIYHHVPTLRPYTIESLASGSMASLYPPTVFLSDQQLLESKQGGLRGASSSSRAKAAFFVLSSLTQKAKELFGMMAVRQITNRHSTAIESSQSTPPHAMPYSSIFAVARDTFLANNVGQMEALLRELRDHEIVLCSDVAPASAVADLDQNFDADIGQRSKEWLWINIDCEDLQSLLNQLQA